MKKYISLCAVVSLLFISGFASVSAYYTTNTYTPYYNNYSTGARSNSYTYTQGCYVYSYDAYTRITSLIGSTCQTNTYSNTNYNSSYYPAYNSNTYPSYSSNTYPSYQTYYTQPTYSYAYTNPYYTYSYNNGYWGQGGSNGFFNSNTGNYGYGNYYDNYVPTPTTNCYYVNSYYTCY